MSLLAVSAGIVTAVRGEAFIRSPEGGLQPVKVGDTLHPGQQILGSNGALLDTMPEVAGRTTATAADIDQAINNLDTVTSDDDAPAAGLTGGDGAAMGQGLRVDRVVEVVQPQTLAFTSGAPDDQRAAPTETVANVTAPSNSETNLPELPTPPATLPFLVVFGQDTVEGQTAEFKVSLTQASASPITVQLALLPGSDPVDAAQPGIDTLTTLEYFDIATSQWMPVSGELTFAAGQTDIRVRVTTLDDVIVEGVEFIQLRATVVSGDTANTVNWADIAITDNDKPFLVVYGQDAVEGDYAAFTVNLTQATTEAVTVRLALLPGSDPVNAAHPAVDTTGPLEYFNTTSQTWEAVTGDLTLAAGQTQIQVRVLTVDDTEIEGLEFLQLQATVISGETANTASHNDTAITDNDKPYMVVFSTDAIEGEHAHFSVHLTSPTAEVVTVELALQAGGTLMDGAQPGVDASSQLEFFNTATQQWDLVTGSLSFQPGETQIALRVATLDDAWVEPVEYLRLQASVVQGSVVNPITWNDVAITDNEGRTVWGTAGADEVMGQAGDDRLEGLGGDDLLIGGRGHDVLVGGDGADVFMWRLSDVAQGQTMVDRIEDFDVRPTTSGGDALDLRDLLQGEHLDGGTGNLTQYLRFDTTGTDTLIQISTEGDLAPGAGTITQEIVLHDVNLRTAYGLDAADGDVAIIARMLADQKLYVDAA